MVRFLADENFNNQIVHGIFQKSRNVEIVNVQDVGLTDAIKILRCSRQKIRNLLVKDQSKSPLSVYEGTPSIWHLADILIWLREEKTYSIDDSLLEIAKINMNFNVARSWQKVAPDLQENIKDLVV